MHWVENLTGSQILTLYRISISNDLSTDNVSFLGTFAYFLSSFPCKWLCRLCDRINSQ